MRYLRDTYHRLNGEVVRIAPVTMPAINLPDLDTKAIEAEARQAQARIRTIRLGRDAWEQISRSASFESYLAIGFALIVGKTHALRVSRANAAWGRNYSREFGEWMNRHGFATMPKSTRSVSIELAENAEAISAWRDSLPECQRKRLIHPLSVTRRWKAAVQAKEQAVTDTRKATAAWARFVAHVEALAPEEALPLWQAAQAQATAVLGATL
jgi:hypothetical protein